MASGMTLLGGVLVWRFERVGEVFRHVHTTLPAQPAALALSYRLNQPSDATLRALLADPVRGPATVTAIRRLAALLDSQQPLSSEDRALLKAIVEQLGAEQP
jgi:hypothetical protein